MEFKIECVLLQQVDELVVKGPTTGALIFKVEELRLTTDPVAEVKKGDRFSMPVPEKIRASDRLYLWRDKSLKS